MKAYGIKPEVEAFDLSMIFQAAAMEKSGKIDGLLHVQFVMGVKNAMPVDREVLEFYVKTLARLSPGATWTGAGIGRDQATLARWSLELGGHCRTGLEDNVRLDKETLAPSNAVRWSRRSRACAPNTVAGPRPRPRRGACSSVWRRRRRPPRVASARRSPRCRARRDRRSLAGGPTPRYRR